MPRRERLDFAGATQWVRLRGREGSHIFFDSEILKAHRNEPRTHADTLRRFDELIAAAVEDCGTILHGYCTEPNTATLVLTTHGASLAAFMSRLSGQYSRYLRRFAPGTVVRNVFGARYDSKVIAPEYLPHAVRRVHRAPVLAGLCTRRMDYPFSSERVYLGEMSTMPLDLHDVKTALEQKGYFGSRGYREFMDQEETTYIANLLTAGSAHEPRIIGSKVFVQQTRQAIAYPPARSTPEELIDAVARLLGKSSKDIYSATHVGVLGRALVAWYGLRSGAGTLTDIGRWFGITGATLGQAIRHYRQRHPDLFRKHQSPNRSR